MDKNIGILVGGVVIAGAVALLSLAPSGSNSGSNPTPSISSSPATVASTPAQQVDQSTARVSTPATPVKSSPASAKAKHVTNTPTTLGGTSTQIGSARGGGDDDGGEGRHRGGEADD